MKCHKSPRECRCRGQCSETKDGPYGIELPMNERPWHVRIPAAIARAKEELRGLAYVQIPDTTLPDLFGRTTYLTATEVALAEEWWSEWIDNSARTMTMDYDPREDPPDALRAFTEKVESLDGGGG